MKLDHKNLLISVLVGYVVLDIVASYFMYYNNPTCFNIILKDFYRSSSLIPLAIAIIVGFAMYYFLR